MLRVLGLWQDIAAAAVPVLLLFFLYWGLIQRDWKRAACLTVFGWYLTAVLVLTGFPNIRYLTFDPVVNPVPFITMPAHFEDTYLNVLLFVPFGFLLPVFFDRFRAFGKTVLAGAAFSALIELSQLFTHRTTDINDLITNTAGTAIGYLIAFLVTRHFTRLVCRKTRTADLFLAAAAVVAVMFFLQPFVLEWVWRIV